MSAAAIIMMRQNRVLRRYEAADATSPERALRPEELGLRDSWILRRLAARGVLVEVEGKRYYLQRESAAKFVVNRRNRVLVLVIIALVIWFLVAFH